MNPISAIKKDKKITLVPGSPKPLIPGGAKLYDEVYLKDGQETGLEGNVVFKEGKHYDPLTVRAVLPYHVRFVQSVVNTV